MRQNYGNNINFTKTSLMNHIHIYSHMIYIRNNTVNLYLYLLFVSVYIYCNIRILSPQGFKTTFLILYGFWKNFQYKYFLFVPVIAWMWHCCKAIKEEDMIIWKPLRFYRLYSCYLDQFTFLQHVIVSRINANFQPSNIHGSFIYLYVHW